MYNVLLGFVHYLAFVHRRWSDRAMVVGNFQCRETKQEGHDGPGSLTWLFQNLSTGLAEEVV